jgi:hypothetical protein
LSPELKRRSVYFYPSDGDARLKLAKLDAQASRLAAKKQRLQELDDVKLPALKAEYDAVLNDGRGDYFKQLLGKGQLAALRDEAKKELDASTKERATLVLEVSAGEEAAESQLLPRADLVEELRKVRELPNGCWRRVRDRATPPHPPAQSGAAAAWPVAVVGPFDAARVAAAVRPASRSSITKKLSVEEEAAQRLAEMSAALAGPGEESEGGGELGGRTPARRASVKERMGAMEKAAGGSGADGSGLGGGDGSGGMLRRVTAAPVPAKSKRVARLLERVHEEQLRQQQEEDEAQAADGGDGSGGGGGGGGGVGGRRQRGDGDEKYGAAVAAAAAAVLVRGGDRSSGGGNASSGEWTCHLCSKRNASGGHLCGTCGRPRGMALHSNPLGAGLPGGVKARGGGGVGVAFGRTAATRGAAAAGVAGKQAEGPQKNTSMMAELQANLQKRRASS